MTATVFTLLTIVAGAIGAWLGINGDHNGAFVIALLIIIAFNLLAVIHRYLRKIDDISRKCTHFSSAIEHFSERNDTELGIKIRNAKKRIYVLTTNLTHFYYSYDAQIKRAIEKNNVELRILSLKPTSAYADTDYMELDFESPKSFIWEISDSLKKAMEWKEDFPHANITVKVYSFTPTLVLYVIDDELYFNPIIPFHKGRECIHVRYKLNENGTKEKVADYLRTFRVLWNLSEEITDVKNLDNLQTDPPHIPKRDDVKKTIKAVKEMDDPLKF